MGALLALPLVASTATTSAAAFRLMQSVSPALTQAPLGQREECMALDSRGESVVSLQAPLTSATYLPQAASTVDDRGCDDEALISSVRTSFAAHRLVVRKSPPRVATEETPDFGGLVVDFCIAPHRGGVQGGVARHYNMVFDLRRKASYASGRESDGGHGLSNARRACRLRLFDRISCGRRVAGLHRFPVTL